MLALLNLARNSLAPAPRSIRHPKVQVWLALTLVYAALVAVLLWNSIAGDPYALADDARQHVFWMMRFVDPELFAGDWIADYYQSVSPIGYIGIYRVLAGLGVSPLLVCKVMPPLLVVLTAIATFFTCLELCALPAAGFVGSALLTQSVEYTGTLASGTSKAFVYGLVLLFMYAWLRRAVGLSWLAIALQGVFYPQAVLLTAGMLFLGVFERVKGRWQVSRERRLWLLTAGGLAISTVVILIYGLASSQFGPTMSAEQALTMPEFFRGGRVSFFKTEWVDYLLYGRGGLRLDTAMTPVTNLLGLVLPLLLLLPKRFPLARSLSPDADILLKLTAVTFFWFVAAHALLFKLYLPSRYTGRFLLMVLVLAGSIAVVILLDGLLKWAIALLDAPRSPARTLLGLLSTGLALALALIVVFYPATMSGYPSTSMVRGNFPELYDYFATQPKASMIAGLAYETSNIPSFAQRSVLTSPEVAIAYHVGYYDKIRQRTKETITAQYSSNPQVVVDFIRTYGVTHWLLDNAAYDIRTLNRDQWAQQYQPEAGTAVSTLASRETPVLQQLSDRCTSFQSDRHRVLDAQCVLTLLTE